MIINTQVHSLLAAANWRKHQ